MEFIGQVVHRCVSRLKLRVCGTRFVLRIILLTVFPMACEEANEVHGVTRFNSRQLHKVPRFCTIHLQLFYGISLIANHFHST